MTGHARLMAYPNDPGLQPERTLLAWLRTCLGLLLNSFLLIRNGALHHQPALIGSGLIAMAAAGWLFATVRARLSAAPCGTACAPDRPIPLALTVFAVLLLCLAGAWHAALTLHASLT